MSKKNTYDIIAILNAVDDQCEILLKLLVNYYNAINEKNGKSQIVWGGRTVDLASTGGVALLEYAKDAISTMISNISGIGTNAIQSRKIVERKLSMC